MTVDVILHTNKDECLTHPKDESRSRCRSVTWAAYVRHDTTLYCSLLDLCSVHGTVFRDARYMGYSAEHDFCG